MVLLSTSVMTSRRPQIVVACLLSLLLMIWVYSRPQWIHKTASQLLYHQASHSTGGPPSLLPTHVDAAAASQTMKKAVQQSSTASIASLDEQIDAVSTPSPVESAHQSSSAPAASVEEQLDPTSTPAPAKTAQRLSATPISAAEGPTSTAEAFPPLPPGDLEEYVAICLIIKNQSIDMPEFFIHHYHHHGIRRFYIYDDGSDIPLSTHPYVDSYGIPESALSFIYIKPEEVLDRKTMQPDTYTDCVNRFGHLHSWLAFLDPDEYLEMRGPDPPTLIEWLKDWERNDTVGALAVQWLSHNSGGHFTIPGGPIRQAYTMCITNEKSKANRHVKSFVRPEKFSYIENIHWVVTTEGTIEVGEHGDRVKSYNRYPITHDKWALHHYATKSREDYELKKARQRVEGGGLTDWWWNEMHSTVNISCPELAKYVP